MRLPQVRLSQYRRDWFLDRSMKATSHRGDAQVRTRPLSPATISSASPIAL